MAVEEEGAEEEQLRKGKPKGPQKQLEMVACITGMPGAGKSTVAEVAEAMRFEVFRMGDDVRMEAQKRKLPPTDQNLGFLMLELRQKGGQAAIAALCRERIEKESKSNFVVIDGIRNINEYFEFKKLGNVVLIAVHAPPQSRFEFLLSRNRSDSPATWDAFEARDRRELSVGIGEAIAMADEMILNSGSKADLEQQAKKLFQRIKKAKQK